ncbi:MAG: PD-(D/E)XK nuclease family protein [Gemmatimonadales bacterium]
MEEQLGFEFLPSPDRTGSADPAPSPDSVEPAPSEVPEAPAARGGYATILESLEIAARRHPRDRKIIVGRTRGEAHELIRQLARKRGSWIGFEVSTLRPLAMELAGPAQAEGGIRTLDEFEEQAFLDEAIDRVLLPDPPERFAALVDSVGFREWLRRSVRTLRLAGVGPDHVRHTPLADPDKIGIVGAILEEYETRLRSERRDDQAAVLAQASDVLRSVGDQGRSSPLADRRIYLLPGLSLRGLPGRFVVHLLRLGATILETDPVVGLDPPAEILWKAGPPSGALSFLHAPAVAPEAPGEAIDLFAAGSITDELREVLRRVSAADAAWDEVEIIASDPQAYGSALHALTQQLDVPVTLAVGLPVERTRPGRAVTAYFSWLDGGFGADVIRRLLEAGDLRPEGHRRHDGVSLARRLRSLRIGWGRPRYLAVIEDQLAAAMAAEDKLREAGEGPEWRVKRRRRELEALLSILAPVIESAPPTPEGPEGEPEAVSPADVARGLSAFLRFVPAEDPVDVTARDLIDRILTRIEATLSRPTEYGAAAAIVRSHLQIRVPAPRAEGRAPWSSAGGHLYLTDLEHGGVTGRRLTFVVGLDADRLPGGRLLDPLLLDADRRALAARDLPTSTDRLAESQFELAALLARLRGSITLSYSAWSPCEAREIAPAAALLDAFRLSRCRPSAPFEELHRALSPLAGPVPRGHGPLDQQDVWLANLEKEGRLLEARSAVRALFPSLDAGISAREAIRLEEGNAFHGIIQPRAAELDPRLNAGRTLSASALESLGACPRQYLFERVLRLYPPDDPVRDPDRWLDPLERGRLLHAVFERVLRERVEGLDHEAMREARAVEILAEEAEIKLAEVPTPSRTVFRRELEGLTEDVRSFVNMTSAIRPPVALELEFGRGGDEPVAMEIRDGTILMRGAVDRVDDRDSGLTIVDYKTGSSHGFEPRSGTFNGGRRLQHIVYTKVVEELLGRRVDGFEYHFPSSRGQNAVHRYERTAYASGTELIGRLLDGVAAGYFPPTENPSDCRFCDYRTICRVAAGPSGKDDSPLLEWAAGRWASGAEYETLRLARTWDGSR